MPDAQRDECQLQSDSVGNDVGIGLEHSVASLLLATGPAYGLLGMAMYGSWELGSAPSIFGVAFLAAALAGVMCSDLAWFKAQGVGILVEAERKRRRGSSRKQRRSPDEVASASLPQ